MREFITKRIHQGCARFPEILQNFSKHQILWSLCSVVFHALTLESSIQISLSAAPKLQFCVRSGESVKNSGKRAHPRSHTLTGQWSVCELSSNWQHSLKTGYYIRGSYILMRWLFSLDLGAMALMTLALVQVLNVIPWQYLSRGSQLEHVILTARSFKAFFTRCISHGLNIISRELNLVCERREMRLSHHSDSSLLDISVMRKFINMHEDL